MLNAKHILELLKKNVRREPLTEQEQEELALALRVCPDEMLDELEEKLEQETKAEIHLSPRNQRSIDASLPAAGTRMTTPRNGLKQWALPAAALFVAVLVFIYRQQAVNPTRIISRCDSIKIYKNGIPPEVDKASLTFFNGYQVLMDSAFQQLTFLQGSTVLTRLKTGEFKYTNLQQRAADSALFNTVTTSRGTQCIFILPDGTMARLNALSSLRFPLYFAGSSRQVTITGEVFFDVSKKEGQPFYVQVNSSRLEVTGTQFNVNAYEPAISTTLLSGSLTIQNGGNSTVLKPGQQGIISSNTSPATTVSLSPADISRITSWKDGFLVFKREPAREAMTEIARWFDLELVNEETIPNWMTFSGVVCRALSFQQLADQMKLQGFRFRAEGKKWIFTTMPG